MTEKRFLLKWLEYEPYYIDTKQEYVDEAELRFELDGYKTMSDEQVVSLLNENEQLKQENDLLYESVNEATNFIYDNFEVNRMFSDRELNDICNDMGWELSEKGIKLKQLEKENEQLKHTVYKYSSQIIAQDNEVIELEKENKRLIKMLDNVANYMQKQHKEVPLDDFVEWWNRIAIGDKDE